MKRSGNIVLTAMITVGILLILGIIAPRFFGCTDKSPWDLAKPKMKPIESAIYAYQLNTGLYPKTLNDLLTCPLGLEDKWAGPYLKEKQLYDPWGNMYIYDPNGKAHSGNYDIISYGKDGKPGGEGYNEDIYSN
jgi:general secretion pathway protein G